MDPGEALDLDKSEPSFALFPCNRTHQITISDQTLEINSTPIRTIPGPAGVVQMAMRRKSNTPQISTQEYLNKVSEPDLIEEDEDFSRDPWLFTVKFLRREGMVDGVAIGTPISAIKTCSKPYIVPQIVAIIKSCKPNGLGDIMVTLKDPTGSIDASIPHKVLADGKFGRDICVGSVLILQKVAIFSPSHAVHYLSIMYRNVIEVFSKDTPLPDQNYSPSTVKHASLVCRKAPHEELSTSHGQIQGVRDKIGSTLNMNKRKHDDIGLDMRSLMARLDGTKQITKMHDGDEQMIPCDINRSGRVYTATLDRVLKPIGSKGLIPEWTDEQLEALFDFGDENNDSFY